MSRRTDTPELEKLQTAFKDLKQILTIHDVAIERLDQRRRGQPGSSFGGSGSGGSGSSPVESALGIGGPGDNGGITPDVAARRLDEIARIRKTICKNLFLLHRILEAEVPHPPTDKQRREVERANTEAPERLCEHCTDHRRLGTAQEVHRYGDVAGNLPHPMGLCRWCYDRVRSDGMLPNGDRLARLKNFKQDAVRV